MTDPIVAPTPELDPSTVASVTTPANNEHIRHVIRAWSKTLQRSAKKTEDEKIVDRSAAEAMAKTYADELNSSAYLGATDWEPRFLWHR